MVGGKKGEVGFIIGKFPMPEAPVPRQQGPRSWDDRYEAALDLRVLRPELTQKQRARELGYTPTWLSLLEKSDMFQMRLAERRRELKELVNDQIAGDMTKVLRAALASALKRLEEKPGEDTDFIHKLISDLLSRIDGFEKGSKNEQNLTVNVTPAERAWQKARAVEAEFTEAE